MNCKSEKINLSFLLFIILIGFHFSTAVAQQSRMDSLSHALSLQTEDTNRVDILLKLSFGHHQIDVSLCRAYATDALKISELLKDTERTALSFNCLGIASDLEGKSLQAISNWEKCLELSKSTNFLTGQMKALNNLGITHQEKGNIEKSLQYFLAALKIDEDRGNIQQTINTLSNIGNLYLSMNDMEHAFKYLQQAIKTGEQVGIPSKLSHPYQRMGEYYVHKKEYESALPFLKKAYSISKDYGQNLRMSTALRLMGQCKYQLNRRADGMASFSEAEKMLIKIGEKYTELYMLYHTWAMVYFDLGEYDKAFEKVNKGFALAKKNNLESSKLSSLQLLGQLHEQVGNYQQALKFHKAAAAQQDSLHLQLKEELVLELDTKYQSSKKEMENDLLRSQQERTEAELRNQNAFMNAIILVLVLLGIVAFLLWRAYRLKKLYNEELQKKVVQRTGELENSNKQLKQSNVELERFAFIASHDLKTPLRNIVSFTNLLERHLGNHDDQQITEYINFLKEGGKRMNTLIEDVLEYSKLSDSKTNGIAEEINLNHLCGELTKTIHTTLEERQAIIEISQPLPTVVGNYSSFFLLFNNLIENAIKYNESSVPEVKIYFQSDANSFSLIFEDNGIGIQEDFFEKIWEMFSRLHNHSKYEGTGLGLATCKKIMDSMDGTIEVSSTVGKGSSFELKFPDTYLAKKSLTNKTHEQQIV